MCGGTVHIFIHELRGEAAREAALLALEALLEERPAAVATLLDGPGAGSKLYVDADRRAGGLGGPELLDANVEREARGLVVQGHSTVREFGEDGATLGSGLRVHVAAFAEPPRMVIFGAIDFSAALAPMAKASGYRVTIADPRRAFLASPRFSAFADTVAAWPDAVLDGVELGPRDAVLVFTHDPKLDVPASWRRWARAPATSARSARARRPTTATPGCARRASTTRGSRASSPRAGSTSAPRRWRRPRSPCSRRSSPTGRAARAGRCARPPARSGAGGPRRPRRERRRVPDGAARTETPGLGRPRRRGGKFDVPSSSMVAASGRVTGARRSAGPGPARAGRRIRGVTDRLYFTDSDEANALIAQDPFALLVGFVLDQQVPVPKAFSGPLVLRERLGPLDAGRVAAADLEPIFRERPGDPPLPGRDGQAGARPRRARRDALRRRRGARVDGRGDAEELKANLEALPGFGEMKVKALGAVLAKRFGVAVAEPLVPVHPTLGDVDSAEALLRYQAAKRAYKTGGTWDTAATAAP